MELTNIIYLSIGSNLGNKLQNIKDAIAKLSLNVGKITKVSSVYESEALGFESDNKFYNICVEVKSMLNIDELLSITQSIEYQIGRKKKTTTEYQSREIDIDILFYNDLVINKKQLKIPHLHFRDRKFVLVPLLDITEEFIDPKTGLTIEKILSKITDKSTLIKTNQTVVTEKQITI